ncbi:serine protease [Desulfococcaceae bacterium HSG8]|nr:serine protease [Desulfococcaceae bacterium HSG8]
MRLINFYITLFIMTSILSPAYADISPRITNGSDAQPGAWPWMTALVPRDASPAENYCGGVLIHPEWVITIANCTEFTQPDELDIVLGIHDLEKDKGTRIRVKRILLNSDIALLELETPAPQETIPFFTGRADPGEEAVTIGWGLTDPDTMEVPDTLQQISLPIVSDEECVAAYGDDLIIENVLCAGIQESMKSVCRGDSGGPLMLRDGNTWKLAGVVARGDCGDPGFFSVYARISRYVDFINQYVPRRYEVDIQIPESASEGDGVLEEHGIVTVQEAPDTDLMVRLDSDHPGEISLPDTVTILAGQTSAMFDITILGDDDLLDGSQIVSITASVADHSLVMKNIRIDDNEKAALFVRVPENASEGDGVLHNHGVVTASNPADKDVAVSLFSDDTSEVTVPDSVVLRAGETAVFFDITIINDGKADGTETVTIIASVEDWMSNSDAITVAHREPDYFTEQFRGDNDMDYQTLTFTPDGSPDFYTLCQEYAETFPIDPAGGVRLAFTNDSYRQAELSGGITIPFYGVRYPFFYIGSNGYITFESGDDKQSGLPEDHFEQPRISALFGDFRPGDSTRISWKQLDDRAVVTYEGIQGAVGSGSSSFQTEMFFNGLIRITWLNIADDSEEYRISGLSKGNGIPGRFVESDLSSYADCDTFISLELPDTASEGETRQGKIRVQDSRESDLRVNLASDDPSVVTIGPTITIPAGQTGAPFDFTVLEDILLNGGRTVVIIASAPGYNTGSSGIEISDISTAELTVTVPETAAEGDGVLTGQGKVTVSKPPDTYVTVSLASDNMGEVMVPQDVTIPAGLTAATFDLTIVYDTETDDTTRTAAITASVPGWTSGTDTIAVTHYEQDYFTEDFDGDNDLSYQTLTFIPDDSVNFYRVCREYAKDLPTDPAEGLPLSLQDDSYEQVALSEADQISLYGLSYSSFYVGSNGFIAFDSEDSAYQESLSDHFRLPRISALLKRLRVEDASVTWKQTEDRAVVTWENARDSLAGENANTFQAEMFFNGVIRITHLAISAKSGITGLSEGNGIPENFIESDLSEYTSCGEPLSLEIPETAAEGDGILAEQGIVRTEHVLETALPVNLISDDPSTIVVPETITIPVGKSWSSFDLTVAEDKLLEGTRKVIVTASAGGYKFADSVIRVADNETAKLTIEIPAQAAENDGVLAGQGTITVSVPVDKDTLVSLESADTSEVTVPQTVTVPAGQNTASFDITIIYDGEADDTQEAEITASVEGWISGTAVIAVAHTEVDFFTEQFQDDNDISYHILTFTPDGSEKFYRVCSERIEKAEVSESVHDDILAGTPVFFQNYDEYERIEVNGGRVSLYNDEYSSFYVGAEGDIIFESPGYRENSLSDHFEIPRISALFGYVYYGEEFSVTQRQTDEKAVVIWQNQGNTFRVEMFFNGAIRMTYLDISDNSFITGLSQGKGMPVNFTESDLSEYDICQPFLFTDIPETAVEGSGDFTGRVSVEDPGGRDILVTLTSSDVSEIVVPESVTIRAGQSSAVFYFTVLEDHLLDGSQSVMITAYASEYHFGHDTIRVSDNETAVLTVNVPGNASENDGLLPGRGMIAVSTPVDDDTAVFLASDDTSEVTVPETVTIPAGQDTAAFDITIIDDEETDGDETVTITASVAGWTSGSNTIIVANYETPDFFTEQFEGDNDLAWQSLAFAPDGSESFYRVCRENVTVFYTDPAGGTQLMPDDNAYEQVMLSGGKHISFYGLNYTSFYITGNGSVTFDTGDSDADLSLSDHFKYPRISGLYADLNPGKASVSWKQSDDRVAVTYQGILGNTSLSPNSFQIEMFFSGVIRITWLDISETGGIAGLSAGNGIPVYFEESDLGEYGLCVPRVFLDISGIATEGFDTKGFVRLEQALESDLTVLMTSDDATEVIVPDILIIPAGETAADFNLTVPDDVLLDGTRQVTITASASGHIPGSRVIWVNDNEIASLSLMIPKEVREGDGLLDSEGIIIVSARVDNDVTVSLASDDTSEITIPGSVLIPAGQKTAAFDITVLDEGIYDRVERVTITASARNCASASEFVYVLDRDSSGLIGDIDYSGEPGLGDVILSLRVLSGAGEGYYIYIDGDTDGDGKIGIEEAMSALKILADGE